MTDTAPDAAVQITSDVIGKGVPSCVAREVVAALARGGWLHDPRRVTALEAVADLAKGAAYSIQSSVHRNVIINALHALDRTRREVAR